MPDPESNSESPLSSGAAAPAANSNSRNTTFARIMRLCQKELRESLRDRRTIITLVLMPLMVYPLLSVIFQRFLFTTADSITATAGYVIGVEDEESAELLQTYLGMGHAVFLADAQKAARESGDREPVETLITEAQKLQLYTVEDPVDRLVRGEVDIVVLLKTNGEPVPPMLVPPAQFSFTHQPNSAASQQVLGIMERYLGAVNDTFLQQRLIAAGESTKSPLTMVRYAAEEQHSTNFSVASLIPLILILMTITGAVYPAIDLTAGERERGTLEALIAAPVPRFHLLLAKYVAVVTVALLTAAANLTAMTVTLYSSGIGKTLFGDHVISFQSILVLFALLVLFASFFSAVLLSVTSFARSFKEAQAYLIPLMLMSLGPGLVCLMGLEFKGILTVAPLVNIVMLSRDIFSGNVAAGPAAIAVISTTLYAAVGIAVAAKIFGADAVLYGGESGLTGWFGRPEKSRPAASLASTLLLLATLFPLFILLSGGLAQLSEKSIGVRLGLSGAVTIMLFGLLPLAFAVFSRIHVASAFNLRPAAFLSFLAAALLGFSLWPLAHELFLLHRALLGSQSFSPEQVDAIQELVMSWREISPLLIILTLAVIPATFEELFFRGFLFSSLLQNLTARQTIIVSAVLFGVFHVVVMSSLAVERFFPSTFMGLILGWVCYRTKSVWPGILLHTCHNGFLVTIGYYKDWLEANRVGIQEQEHLPANWLAFAALGTMTGILVFKYIVHQDEVIETS